MQIYNISQFFYKKPKSDIPVHKLQTYACFKMLFYGAKNCLLAKSNPLNIYAIENQNKKLCTLTRVNTVKYLIKSGYIFDETKQ